MELSTAVKKKAKQDEKGRDNARLKGRHRAVRTD